MGGGGRFRQLRLLLRFLLLSAAAAQKLPEQEVEALKGIAHKLNKMDWDFTVDPCTWPKTWVNSTNSSSPSSYPKHPVSNVTCDCSFKNNTECHITHLQLMRQNLSGILPEEAANLTYLIELDLSRNVIEGPIPASWVNLPVFNLSLLGNRISGTIPKELGRMPLLKSINLEGNQLEGPIPPELGNIISLERFFISANNITGELPSTFSRLTNMIDFRIDGTNISGRIPSFIKNWQRVNRIDMQGTLMSGPIPLEISLLKNLTELRVIDLSGPSMKFPTLKYAQHLTEVDLSFNKLIGQIPENFIGMGELQYLDVSYNNFMGNPPAQCQQANVNMVSSFYLQVAHSSLFINCGGKSLEVDGNIYADDSFEIGTSTFVLSDDKKWAYNSTGDFVGNENADYIARNTSKLTLPHPE